MNNINWYFNLYYKFRDYPIGELNSTLKNNELKTLYNNMLRKTFALFQLDTRKDGDIEGLISKNNYDLMLNKKAENNLAQEEVAHPTPATVSPIFQSPNTTEQAFNSSSSIGNEKEPDRSDPHFNSEDSHMRSSQYSSQGRRQSKGWVVELGPLQRNMDVFYELMIKMIRVSFRRLMIQTFALDRYGMHVSKEAIKEILQVSSEFEPLIDYSEKKTQKEEGKHDQIIEIVQYPPTVDQMKFQFLKYCISSKVYNNPREVPRVPSSSSSLSSQGDLLSNQSVASQKKQSTPVPAPQISDNEIEELILKVSAGETSIFNKIIELYQKEVKNSGKSKTQILGVKHIAQTILDFANREFFNQSMPLIFGAEHTSMKRGINQTSFRNHAEESLSNNNILLATWLDLILFKESPHTLLQIIEELVKMQNKETILAEPTPLRTERGKTPESKEFYYKISSFLHILILNSTKNIFIQSLLKINYLLVLSKDVIGGQCGFKQSFRSINFKKYQEKVDGVNKVYDNIQLTYDAWNNKYLWKEEAIAILISKWKVIANVITQLCAKNSQIFFVAIFQKCVTLLDRQLEIQVALISKLMTIAENIEGDYQLSANNDKAKHICKVLCGIIKEIIGFGDNSSEVLSEGFSDKYLNINNIINSKSEVDRYKETTFANREEAAEEISKWNEIISQNIYLYSQYQSNLDTISKIFKNNYLYVALWFNKFHSETKALVKKVSRDRLENIFDKFSLEITPLWESMTTDNDKGKPQKSRFKRAEKNKIRNRISSIKVEKTLSIIQKKAIVLNYMIKAELELYSHYMLINYLNSQKNFSQLFEKDTKQHKSIKSKPQIFSHRIIKKIVLFSAEHDRLKTIKLEKETYANITRRTQKQMTYRFEEGCGFNVEDIRTMNNIKKNNANCDFQDLLNAIHHFQKPMDLELTLEEKWKERFGEQQIEYLGEVNDYVRYLNEINYLYEFWSWQESNGLTKEDKQKNQKQKRMELLDGSEYSRDLDEIDLAFAQIENNENLVKEVSVFKGESNKIMHKQQLNEMLKRIKIHNKELYMIIEAIIEGENYFKLIGSNLIGRDQNSKFKAILEEIITYYRTNNREKPSVKMLEKMRETLQLSSQVMKKDSKAVTRGKVSELHKPEDSIEAPLPELCRKNSKKASNGVSQFQFAPEYYKIQSKIFRINCLIAALEVDNPIFRNIKHSPMLSIERLEKLTIIGGPYYDKLEDLLQVDKLFDTSELMIGEDTLMRIKNIYEKKLMLLIVAVINMNYTIEDKVKRFTGRGRKQVGRVQFSNISEEDLRSYPKVLQKYTDLMKKFLYSKIKQNIKRVEQREIFERMNTENDKKDQKQFSVCTFVEEVLELSEKNEQCDEELLLIQLQLEIAKENNMKFSQEFKKVMEEETSSLEIYDSEEEKVEYLRKKLSYLLMREIYFTLNYQTDFLTEKSVNSKKNYGIYEERILKFYEEIAKLDYEQYMEKKEEEIKKRSMHLKNYEFKYECKPMISKLESNVNQLICCLFNQLLTIYTTKAQQRMMNNRPKPSLETDFTESSLYQKYCATSFLKKITKEEQKVKPLCKTKKKKQMKKKESISSIFAHIFFNRQQTSQQQQIASQNQNTFPMLSLTPADYTEVLIYSKQKFELSQSLKVYFKILADGEYSYSNLSSSSNSKKYSYYRSPPSFQQPITEQQLELMKNNQASLISLLKSQFLENINTMKCKLMSKNLISNVQKLYINLDVRHKVFESFKDRILNYQLQKAKIYHQYMDYIRGLKLDVYSHMVGQDSAPYIKIIQGIKLYRLKIKKKELQDRVNQEFQKNLLKWNQGIQTNLEEYKEWLCHEQQDWLKKQGQYRVEIKTLLDIYNIVKKEVNRQNKMIKKRITASTKSIGTPQETVEKILQVVVPTPKPESTLKKFTFLKQKQHRTIQFSKYTTETPGTKTCKMTESTKQNTRHEKITMTNHSASHLRGHSNGGLRGLTMKYDISNYLNNQPQKQEKQRMTQTLGRSGVKTANATIYNRKEFKRYQSAQKFRPHEDFHMI